MLFVEAIAVGAGGALTICAAVASVYSWLHGRSTLGLETAAGTLWPAAAVFAWIVAAVRRR